MLLHPTFDKLKQLRLAGMARAFEEQQQLSEMGSLSFEERLGLLLDRESTERESKALASRLKRARLRQEATPEDIDFKAARGLDRSAIIGLLDSAWLRDHRNVLITGPTGVGKTYLACAIAHKACRNGASALYYRLPRLLPDLAVAKVDGRFRKLLEQLARTDVLILDDWGLAPMTPEARHDLLEILDDRHGRKSTVVTSQLPAEHWHEAINDPTLADAILDRLVHNAYSFKLSGESMRKKRAKLTNPEGSE
ncbi:MAG: IS21-like element helper ATPase IstB [Sulfurimicrobium sp.]|nr:IS21-like element helper ATPase IstB [Sulfurimicrobium sp.]MDP2199931.1 IS21-like element helper ATPase IstB [Sulfurimicrobium sp.]MDP3687482.1 IS21-like element helper ATPase IstB [Sulfurimicrobium sp.]